MYRHDNHDAGNRSEEPEEIKVASFENNLTWSELTQKARNKFSNRVETIALAHTPRDIGDSNIQLIFYHECYNKQLYSRHFRATSWDEVRTQAVNFLDQYIAPHQLISVSLFEDTHPNHSQHYNVIVSHTAGESPAALPRVRDQIYSYKWFEGDFSNSMKFSALN